MIKFGTGGWRAIIGEDFTKENVRILSQAVADRIKLEKREASGFAVGYDRRFLSDTAAKWLSEVMAGNGIKVYFIPKTAPTPLIMFTVQKYHTMYGAAVTASHNPAEYNGIKLFTEGGRDATEDVTAGIEDLINQVDPARIKSVDFQKGVEAGAIEPIDPFNAYIDSILGMTD